MSQSPSSASLPDSDEVEFVTDRSASLRASRRKRRRLLLGAILVLMLLFTARFARQEVLDRRLAFAIINNRDREAMHLLEQGANAGSHYYSTLENGGPGIWTRLMAAIMGRYTFVEGKPLLVVALENQLQDSKTGFYLPPTQDRQALIKMLVERGADPNAQIYFGSCMLEIAIFYDCYDLTTFLLAHGADVNLRGDNQEPMLHYALHQQDRRIFFLILSKNPDLIHEDPASWQKSSVRPEYIQALQERRTQQLRGN